MIMPLPGSSHMFSSQVEGRLAKSRYLAREAITEANSGAQDLKTDYQDFFLPSISMMRSTSSPIAPRYVFMPKSERLNMPRAENPTESILSSGF
jgi:hypothetical protein